MTTQFWNSRVTGLRRRWTRPELKVSRPTLLVDLQYKTWGKKEKVQRKSTIRSLWEKNVQRRKTLWGWYILLKTVINGYLTSVQIRHWIQTILGVETKVTKLSELLILLHNPQMRYDLCPYEMIRFTIFCDTECLERKITSLRL